MAHTTVESVSIVKPLKVIAIICALISLVLLIIAIASTSWLETEGYRQGLWEECMSNEATGDTVCVENVFTDWIIACAALCIIALLIDLTGTIFIAVGLASRHPDRKFTFYRVAMCFTLFAVLLMVIALIVFPVMFIQKLDERDPEQTKWFFGWAYGVAWGAAIFLFGAAILLLVDRESDEIYYREKTYHHESVA